MFLTIVLVGPSSMFVVVRDAANIVISFTTTANSRDVAGFLTVKTCVSLEPAVVRGVVLPTSIARLSGLVG